MFVYYVVVFDVVVFIAGDDCAVVSIVLDGVVLDIVVVARFNDYNFFTTVIDVIVGYQFYDCC